MDSCSFTTRPFAEPIAHLAKIKESVNETLPAGIDVLSRIVPN